jgi:hypothetical protein
MPPPDSALGSVALEAFRAGRLDYPPRLLSPNPQMCGRRLKLRDLQVLLTVARYGSMRNRAAPTDVTMDCS